MTISRSSASLVAALVASAALVACSSDSATPASSNRGGAGGTGGADASADSAGGSGGTGGATDAAVDATVCEGVDSTITAIANGTVAPGTAAKLTGVVAMSSKWLVSKSKKGTCIWGVFVSEPGLTETAEYSGTLAIAYGTDAPVTDAGSGTCPTGTDPIPNDVAPGDVLDIIGKADSYVYSGCATIAVDAGTAAPAAGIQFSNVCSVVKKGTATVPAAAVVSSNTLGNAAAAADHAKWGNVLVQVQGVTGVDIPNDGGAPDPVGAYGIIKLEGTDLEIHDKLYYPTKGAPTFGEATTWSSVVGLSYLDFCTWSLQPRDKCTDFTPPSLDCPGADAGATDAGSADAATE